MTNIRIKDVPNYVGSYLIDEYGKLFSLKSNKWLGGEIDKNGYKVYTLYKNGKPKKLKAHRIVAEAFISQDDRDVNHIDGNKLNNHFSNLEYCTPKENTNHAIDNGIISVIGENNNDSKLTKDNVLAIRKYYDMGFTQKQIADAYLMSRQAIGCICRKETWSHI